MISRYRLGFLLLCIIGSLILHSLVVLLLPINSSIREPLSLPQSTIKLDSFAFESPMEVLVSLLDVEAVTPPSPPVASSSSVTQKPSTQRETSSTTISTVLPTQSSQTPVESPSSAAGAEKEAPSASSPTSSAGGATSRGSILVAGAIDLARQSAGQVMGTSSSSSGKEEKIVVSSSTKDYRFKQYIEDWRQKVQRVGKLAYPEGDINRKVLVRVIIAADGTLHQVKVIRTSQNPQLDEAAIKTVKMAAPYAPFPSSFPKETKYIQFERWWSYENSFS